MNLQNFGMVEKMLTPKEWNNILRPITPTNHAKKVVAQYARAYLIEYAQDMTLSTNELVEVLYPRSVADQSLEGDEARMRIYKLVAMLALDGMNDCATRGDVEEGKKFMGRPVRPWLWHAPKVREVCCLCGQALPEEK